MQHNPVKQSQGPDASRRQRRTPQERLDAALRRMNSLQTKIQQIRTSINTKSRKERTRQLILAGVVLEQLFRQGVFAKSCEHPPAWWLEQENLLQEKDRATWISLLRSLGI
jgi:hypothetical protein